MARPYPGSGASMADSRAAVLFDVDGTLLDTNYLHVMAWWESFLARGHEVSCFDIHRALGQGSTELVQSLLGERDDAVAEGHEERWGELRPRMIAFRGAADLARACAERGLRVVLATSGTPEDVEDFRAALGIDDVVHAVVNSGDVEQHKPAPDIVLAALAVAGVTADRAVMVGDTVYDVRAAQAAGVPCISLLAGGIGEVELRKEDPAAVYANCSELLQGLADSPLAAL